MKRTAIDIKPVSMEGGQLNYNRVLPPAETPEDKVRNYIRVKNWWTPDVYIQQEEVTKHGLTTERVLEIVKEVRAEKTEYSGHAACGRSVTMSWMISSSLHVLQNSLEHSST